ncbi:MAG: FAD-binding oxidoreductase [Pyrinomonadaceae bacterium MAG19_C2-C3]|nr:FAD-binding oxidoreductase [Pyrinomonadaceae bacterium MAG19_C2-C3]
MLVNDIHSQLNETPVRRIVKPDSLETLRLTIQSLNDAGEHCAVAGGRHAMGGQQFLSGETLIDMSLMNRVISLDPKRGMVDVEAGAMWTGLIDELHRLQQNESRVWSIIQKQTGADNLTLGGSLAANVHGRGLRLKPIIGDVESFVLVDANAQILTCSRTENAELFRLVIGGYGLFGVIAQVRLRLALRHKLRRIVRVMNLNDISAGFQEGMNLGFEYGDFQFMTDDTDDGFMHKGVLSCYLPVEDDVPIEKESRELSPDDWSKLLYLAHTNRGQAFELYAQHYLATDRQIYFSDTHQLSTYLDDYHAEIDRATHAAAKGTEMITEIYVPRDKLTTFMLTVREDFRRHAVEFIYGTIRLIEQDDESFLAWAKQNFACIIFNLHVEHNDTGIAKARNDFRRLIDRAIEFGGSFYLTYHRWATREQIEICYPQFADFLECKREFDGRAVFQSDWYRHHAAMFAA